MSREPSRVVFREDQLIVHFDVKDPAGPFDHLDVNADLFTNRSRQTGGLRAVVSLDAELNADVHCSEDLSDRG